MKTTYNLKDLTASQAIAKGEILFKAWKEFHEEKARIERLAYAKKMMLAAMAKSRATTEQIGLGI